MTLVLECKQPVISQSKVLFSRVDKKALRTDKGFGARVFLEQLATDTPCPLPVKPVQNTVNRGVHQLKNEEGRTHLVNTSRAVHG